MQVLHVSTYDGGQGAARAAFRLHRALGQHGIDSAMRVAISTSGDASVFSPRSKPRRACALLRSTVSWWLSKPQRSTNTVVHSVAALPSCLDRELNQTSVDVLHLHWLQDEFLSVEAIGRLRGPVVWTLHDTWPFCGSEHYPANAADRRFVEGYRPNNRPLNHRCVDLDRHTWQRKRRSWQQLLPELHLVAPSHWMAQQAAASALFAGVPCRVIPNAIPEVFRPIPKQQARSLLGWSQRQRLILFGAMDGTADPRKGFDLLAAALRGLVAEPAQHDLAAVVLGQAKPADGIPLPLPVRYIGQLHDDLSLALAYAAADVVVVPSRLDNLPQSATEALACGTPVVAFRQGGMTDLVEHQRTGWLAEPESVEDLRQGLVWSLDFVHSSHCDPMRISQSIVQTAYPAAVAASHADLYTLLRNQSHGLNTRLITRSNLL